MNFEDLKNLDINDLDVNNIGDWPGPVKGIVLVIAFAVAIGGGFYLFIKDRLTELERVEAKESDLKTEFAGKQARAANLDAYKAQLEEMRRSFGAMLRQLPGEAEIDDLLIDISRSGLAAGLDQDAFVPQPEVSKEFYAEVPIRIRLSGNYHQFGEFVSSVAAMPRIVTLHNIAITPVTDSRSGQGNQQQDSGPLSMELVAKTYRYLEEGEATDSGNQGGTR